LLSGENRKAAGDVEVYEKKPDKSLFVVKVGGSISSKEIYNGNSGWLWGVRTGTQEATANQLQLQRKSNAWDSGDVDRIKALYSTLVVKEKRKLDERDVFVLAATDNHGKVDTIFIDAETFLLYRYDLTTDSVSLQPGIAFPTKIYLEDYVEINGVKLAMTVRQVMAAGTAIIRLDPLKIKFNILLDDKLFTKP
jgi:hypothetical protein